MEKPGKAPEEQLEQDQADQDARCYCGISQFRTARCPLRDIIRALFDGIHKLFFRGVEVIEGRLALTLYPPLAEK